MACTWIERDEIFERYARGTIGRRDRKAFEDHFFECPPCFDKLQAYLALRTVAEESAAETGELTHARSRVWRWAWVPAAAALIVAVVAVWTSSSRPGAPRSTVAGSPPAAPGVAQPPAPAAAIPPAPPAAPVVALSVLARVDPPAYIPGMLRGPLDASAESFDAAMRQYLNGRYRAAIPGLRAAAAARPDVAQYVFFLAACQLLDDQIARAVAGLQKTIALGESPYLEDAHFYLAKARLRQGDIDAARTELLKTIDRHGMLEQDARALVAQIDVFTAEKGRQPGK